MDQTVYWVWLQQCLGYASPSAEALLESGLRPKELFEMTDGERRALGLFAPGKLVCMNRLGLETAEKTLEQCAQAGYRVITPDSPCYPEALRQLRDAPLVLYLQGELEPGWDNCPAIAIVGKRDASAYGERVAENLSYDLSKAGFTIVSGLALGIDAQAHLGAVKAEGKTIAVVGCGLDILYPKENLPLRERILQSGAVLSEYPPGTVGLPRNFPVRNRILSGLSLGVIVVEAGRHSGALVTASHALNQGREVFAVPTDIYDPNGEGCLRLIQDGAKLVTCAADVAEEFSFRLGAGISLEKLTNTTQQRPTVKPKKLEERRRGPVGPPTRRQSTETDGLSEDEKRLLELLEGEPKSLTCLAMESRLTAPRVMASLTRMELMGLVLAHPGNRYSRANLK